MGGMVAQAGTRLPPPPPPRALAFFWRCLARSRTVCEPPLPHAPPPPDPRNPPPLDPLDPLGGAGFLLLLDDDPLALVELVLLLLALAAAWLF